MVAIAGPPPTRSIAPRHVTLPAGAVLTRIYNRDYLGPDQYNGNGPRARFDHHDPGLPRSDPHHGVYYAADDLAGCIIEVFGDRGEIETLNYGVATVTLRRDLLLLDLNGDGAWEAGSVAALTQDADRAATQPWSRHFYDDQATYGALDGLRYENAHNHAQAYVLFERAGSFTVMSDRPLADPSLQMQLFRIADQLHLKFAGH
jgi:hypothetical protein